MEVNIIYLVGVIGSGKDYFVETYKKKHPKEEVFEIKIGSTLTKIASYIYGVDLSNKELYEEWKYEESNRVKLVKLSESIKYYLGNNIFVKNAVDNIINKLIVNDKSKKTLTFIISDSCFPSDISFIYKEIDSCYHHYRSDYTVDHIVHFCNYKSPKYCLKEDQPREKFPIFLINEGFKDNTEWLYSDFEKIISYYKIKQQLLK